MNRTSASSDRGNAVRRALRELGDAKWRRIYRRLVVYAETRMMRLVWRGVRASKVPDALRCFSHGKGPEDIVGDVIESALTGTRRWDPGKQPELVEFLRGAVSSHISHLVRSTENRALSARNVDSAGRPAIDLPKVLEARESLERVQNRLSKLRWQDDLGPRIVSCFEQGMTKPAEIAAHLQVDVRRVYKTVKRLIRELARIREDV